MCPGRYQGQHLVHRVLLNLGVCGPGLSENRRPVSSHLGFSVNTFRDYTDGATGERELGLLLPYLFQPWNIIAVNIKLQGRTRLAMQTQLQSFPPTPTTGHPVTFAVGLEWSQVPRS